LLLNTYNTRREAQKRKETENAGRTWISQHIFTGFGKYPSQDVDTAKAHVSVGDVSRQPFFLAILLEFAVREDIEKAGCSTGCKITTNLALSKAFHKFFTD